MHEATRELSQNERAVLDQVAHGDPRLIFDGGLLFGLARRGLVEASFDGWIVTPAGRRALREVAVLATER